MMKTSPSTTKLIARNELKFMPVFMWKIRVILVVKTLYSTVKVCPDTPVLSMRPTRDRHETNKRRNTHTKTLYLFSGQFIHRCDWGVPVICIHTGLCIFEVGLVLPSGVFSFGRRMDDQALLVWYVTGIHHQRGLTAPSDVCRQSDYMSININTIVSSFRRSLGV